MRIDFNRISFFLKLLWRFVIVFSISIIIIAWIRHFEPFLLGINMIPAPLNQWFGLDTAALASAFTVAGVMVGFWQILTTQRNIEKITETKILVGTRKVLEAIIDAYKRPDTEEIFFVAATVAIGATGAKEKYKTYKDSTVDIARRLGGKFHAIFIDAEQIHYKEEDGKIIELNPPAEFNSFYQESHSIEAEEIQDLAVKTRKFYDELKESKINFQGTLRLNEIAPHFVLVNPTLVYKRRFAIIWIIDYPKSKEGVVSAGFTTSNNDVIRTMHQIFEGMKSKFDSAVSRK